MNNHRWDVTPTEAIAIQRELQREVKIQPLDKEIKYIGGADISLNRFSDIIFAGIIILSYPDFTVVDYALLESKTSFPYIPGLLSFREVPALVDVWNNIKIKPDVLVVDGQGIAHPRKIGIASHLGVLLDIPTIGCAKSPLYGVYEEPDPQARSFSYIYDKKNSSHVLGAAVRTKDNVKPIIVSPGHKIDVEKSVTIMLESVRGYRIPEPTRKAHELVNEFRKGEIKDSWNTLF